jgi:hypothetical protein
LFAHSQNIAVLQGELLIGLAVDEDRVSSIQGQKPEALLIALNPAMNGSHRAVFKHQVVDVGIAQGEFASAADELAAPQFQVEGHNARGIRLRQFGKFRQADCGALFCGALFCQVEDMNISDRVLGGGRVFGRGRVFGCGRVFESGRVFGCGRVFGGGRVFEGGRVSGRGRAFEGGRVFEHGKAFEGCEVFGVLPRQVADFYENDRSVKVSLGRWC